MESVAEVPHLPPWLTKLCWRHSRSGWRADPLCGMLMHASTLCREIHHLEPAPGITGINDDSPFDELHIQDNGEWNAAH